MPELVVAYLDGTEERFPLAGQDVFIGRDTQLLVSIPDSKISRRHARLFQRRGAWFIEDLGSVNGVLIDGVRITTAVACGAGQEMHIGDAVLRVVADAPKAPSHSAAGAGQRPGAAPAGSFSLKVSEGPLKGLNLQLQGTGPKVLGRDAQSDLIAADSSISRRHVRLTRQGGQVLVEDLGSSNGTFVNEERVQRGVLPPGGRLRLGQVTLVLHGAGEAAGALSEPKGTPKAAASRAQKPNRGLSRRSGKLGRKLVAGLGAAAVVVALAGGYVLLVGRPAKPVPKAAPTAQGDAAKAAKPRGTAPPQEAEDAAPARVPQPEPASRAEPDAPGPAPAATLRPQAAVGSPDERARPKMPAPPGRLARAWARLTGQGPSSLERSRARTLAALYNKALTQSRTAEREAALATVQQLLQQDALHEAGRTLQAQLLLRASETDALRRAQSAMQAGQALEALGIVSQALDRPYSPAAAERGPRPTGGKHLSAEGQELMALGDQAAVQLGQACGERAQAACMAQAWAPCIAQLACVLGYQPQATQARALLTLATDAVGSRAPEQAPAGSGPAAETLAQAQATVARYGSRYPQAALRQAVLVYSTGDIAAASQRLRPLTCPQCRVVGGDVRRVALGLPRAKQLRESGQHEAAHALYDDILKADGRLCPPPAPSVLHDLALEGKQAVYLLQGTAAFERGAYKEALAAFLAGRALGPTNDGLEGGIARLEHRAQDMLGSLRSTTGKNGARGSLPAAVCTHLHEVFEMTASTQEVHHEAEQLLERCPQRP